MALIRRVEGKILVPKRMRSGKGGSESRFVGLWGVRQWQVRSVNSKGQSKGVGSRCEVFYVGWNGRRWGRGTASGREPGRIDLNHGTSEEPSS
ncbi:unnamed protein product [Clonostachys byssicola]|uniref:Uncharacterized protein n=1 Tax=Clonostachys byssicola TaxID=160290 RepID=A0A9N9Y9F3_9HYPO|nr:unnamed protein product [Clonostachys byssicola]